MIDYRVSLRALLEAMQAWLKDGKEPPASEYPRIAKDQLVTLGAYAFPKIPGVAIPTIKREAYRLDFSVEPPKASTPYPTLIPQVDPDGNETSGIKMPEVASSAGFLHGMESAQQEYRSAGGTVQHGWIVDSVSGE